MKLSNLNILEVGDYKFRRFSFGVALVFFIYDMLVLYVFADSEVWASLRVFINMLMSASLLIAITCKEKIDDERTLAYRYGAYKLTFISGLTVLIILTFLRIDKGMEPIRGMIVFYVFNAIMLFYFLVYKLSMRFDMKWVLVEPLYSKGKDGRTRIIMIGFALLLGIGLAASLIMKILT